MSPGVSGQVGFVKVALAPETIEAIIDF